MTPPDASGQPRLLEEVSWIRRLARELVADRDLAEDLVQETCVVALQRGPREPGKLRQWLAEVLRNALRQHARSAGRRRVREVRAARPEALEPADRLVERAMLQRELVDAVLALDEPYRSTVLLRYFDELPPREIARTTGTPLATVQSRLQRALARLRERLDDRDSAWAALLLPWVGGTPDLATPTLLSLLMKTKLTLAAAATVLVAGALWWSRGDAGDRAAPRLEAQPELARPSGGASAPASPSTAQTPAGSGARTVRPAVAAPASGAPPLAEPWRVRLRVLDTEGLPLAGIAVRALEGEDVLGTSGAGGWCLFDTREDSLVLHAADPRWVTVHEGRPSRVRAVDPVLVAAPAVEVAGTVRDDAGRPLAGARVRLQLPRGFMTRFDEPLEAGRGLDWRATSEADGRYALTRVPVIAGSTVVAVLAGYEHPGVPAPSLDAFDLDLVLTRPTLPLAGVLRGQVLEPSGARVPGARVGLGLASVVTDEAGDFEIPLARAVTSEVLTAVKAGFLPARMERPGEPEGEATGWPEHVVLVLPGEALSIRGRVVDHEGEPVAGARVWVNDPTPSAPIGMMPGFLEPLMAGARVPAEMLETEASPPPSDGDGFFDWHTNVDEPSALWSWVVTDSSGRFELRGLDRRRYRLDVMRPDSLEVATSRAIAAGTSDAEIRLEAPDLFEVVEGRVLALGREPVEGARVRLFRPVSDTTARVYGGDSQVVVLEDGPVTVTDAEGRFRFEDVPTRGAKVTVRGDGIVPTTIPVDAASLEVPVELRCHLEVVLAPESLGRFDGVEVADAEGERLDILVMSDGSISAWSDVPFVNGRTGVVSVSSRGRELRLLLDGEVVETRMLDLIPGDVNRVEL